MNVSTITVPRDEAADKLREYRRRVHRDADSEYARVLRAYEAAASGRPLLMLSQVMAAAPRDVQGRPMLAVARSDRPQVQVTATDDTDIFRTDVGSRVRRHAAAIHRIPRPTPPALTQHRALLATRRPNDRWEWHNPTGFALVPLVPPAVARGHDLTHRVTLWEVTAWADTPILAGPDRDPYLLQALADDLYVVVGEWDLTELEQAIMRGRART